MFGNLLIVGAAIAAMSLTSAGVAQTSKPVAAKSPTAPNPIPRAKYLTGINAEFAKIDTDHNKILSRKEIEAAQAAFIAAAIDSRRRALFAALDADHNGTLTAAEFARLQLPAPRVEAAPFLAQNDSNKDGQVTLIEYQSAKLGNFDRMDTNKDGIVTPAELRAAGLIK